MNEVSKHPRRALVQLNMRLPATDREALQRLAIEGGISMSGLLGAIVHVFLSEHDESVPEPVLNEARSLDSKRRSRPHLGRRHRGTS